MSGETRLRQDFGNSLPFFSHLSATEFTQRRLTGDSGTLQRYRFPSTVLGSAAPAVDPRSPGRPTVSPNCSRYCCGGSLSRTERERAAPPASRGGTCSPRLTEIRRGSPRFGPHRSRQHLAQPADPLERASQGAGEGAGAAARGELRPLGLGRERSQPRQLGRERRRRRGEPNGVEHEGGHEHEGGKTVLCRVCREGRECEECEYGG